MTGINLNTNHVSNIHVKGNKKVLSEHYYFKKDNLQTKESIIEIDKTKRSTGIKTELRSNLIYY